MVSGSVFRDVQFELFSRYAYHPDFNMSSAFHSQIRRHTLLVRRCAGMAAGFRVVRPFDQWGSAEARGAYSIV